MNITIVSQGYRYDGGGWRIEVVAEQAGTRYEITTTPTGSLTFSSGINLDELAELIVAAKAHTTANGINWAND